MEDRLLYRVTEVAVFLNVSRSKVYELPASGELRSVKIDRNRLLRAPTSATMSSRFGPCLSRRILSAATSSISSSDS
jgi:excisionase family DNA binding protein